MRDGSLRFASLVLPNKGWFKEAGRAGRSKREGGLVKAVPSIEPARLGQVTPIRAAARVFIAAGPSAGASFINYNCKAANRQRACRGQGPTREPPEALAVWLHFTRMTSFRIRVPRPSESLGQPRLGPCADAARGKAGLYPSNCTRNDSEFKSGPARIWVGGHETRVCTCQCIAAWICRKRLRAAAAMELPAAVLSLAVP